VKAPPTNVSCDMLRSHEVNRPSIDRVMARIRKRPMTTLRVTDMREQQRADGAQDPP
jgi:hypothetical protein